MGRGKRARTQRRHFKQARENVWKKPKVEGDADDQPVHQDQWEPLVTQNESFEQYYKEQRILNEDEWDDFVAVLQKPLPATFRINSSGQFCGDILAQFENDFLASLTAEDTDGNLIEQLRPLPWYPNKFAWHSNFSRSQLRKNQTLERFHEFLKLENEIGNITRQEAVSMVPPLFLDVEPHHYILDMCAAPGSKTFQLLEMIHKPEKFEFLPAGMVIANDVDVQRCNLLIHQTKRMCSANLIVTNHEAQHFPSCHVRARNSMLVSSTESENSEMASLNGRGDQGTMSQLAFDRVLCDVPCSGDGTIRKAPDIWKKWNTGLGNGVHRLQVQIAMRGISLLKVGGRLVYSTCSMNPVEDEAVVAEVLRQSHGSLELLDVSSELPELKRRPGLKSWKVRDRGKWLSSFRQVDRHRRTAIVPSMFPSGATLDDDNCLDVLEHPKKMDTEFESKINHESEHIGESEERTDHLKPDGSKVNHHDGILSMAPVGNIQESNTIVNEECEAETSDLPLERCMRIMPHDQDTGAFFIAIFKKVSHFYAENSKSSKENRQRNVERKCNSEDKEVASNVDEAQECNLKSESGNNQSKKDGVITRNQDETKESLTQSEIGNDPAKNVLVGNGIPLKHADEGDKVENSNLQSLTIDDIDLPLSANESDKSQKENVKNISIMEKTASSGEGTAKFSKERQGCRRKAQQQGRWRGIDPVLFLTDESTIKSIRDFYGIDEAFTLNGHLVIRNSEAIHAKRIYYVSSSVREAIKLNFQSGQQLKIASIGLKVFERQTLKEGASQCMYRISSEGLPLLLPYLRKQIINVSLPDFVLLLSCRSVNSSKFQDPIVQAEASRLLPGCCVMALHTEETTAIAVGCWKGKTNLSLMVSKPESEELLERLAFKYGGDILGGPMLKANISDISEGHDNILDDIAQKGNNLEEN
eukprot:TRINITY_DN14791_c0_g1_i1.p1 TRINITY_DN14791_c0_g1~~TRINITY_DN14791_c0_g1_i1.p1  ORF type:complete len:927 (+),score=216.89 TRINITY_DN14791_c0_g1_i1:226-3006(+)